VQLFSVPLVAFAPMHIHAVSRGFIKLLVLVCGEPSPMGNLSPRGDMVPTCREYARAIRDALPF
jgi:hypothetical protein